MELTAKAFVENIGVASLLSNLLSAPLCGIRRTNKSAAQSRLLSRENCFRIASTNCHFQRVHN